MLCAADCGCTWRRHSVAASWERGSWLCVIVAMQLGRWGVVCAGTSNLYNLAMDKLSVAPFVYTGHAGRVLFGAGSLGHLEREITLLGAKRALVLSTPEQAAQADDLASRLGARCAGVFARAVMHVPVETAREARDEAARVGADCAIAIGGGSTTGLGKAIALESALPILAIPTTYAGSEMTAIYGITEGGQKKTGRDARVLPKTVIYDPELTLGLPTAMSATSGMNAIAHAVEALYAVDANPVISMMSEEGIRALAQGLPVVMKNPRDIEARTLCLYGAWLCGMALNGTSMALHTSCATRWAARLICRTPKPTRWCCRMPPPTTQRLRQRRWRGWRGPWG